MATWQYDFRLIPPTDGTASTQRQPLGDQQPRIGEDQVAADVGALLPSMPSWHPSLRMWGTDEGNRIDIWFDGGRIDEIVTRVDVRNISIHFLQGLVDVAQRNRWLAVLDDASPCQLAVTALLEAIRKSDAFAFVQDPLAYLKLLDAERQRRGQAGS